MARRIEIELTSKLDDRHFTWRAAGAREPRGTLDASLLPGQGNVGDVYRAEVDSGLDGFDVLSVVPRKVASPLDPRGEQLPLLRPAVSTEAVSVTYAEKGRGRRSDASRDRDDRPRDRGGRPRDRGDRRPRERRADGPRTEGARLDGARPDAASRPPRERRAPRVATAREGRPDDRRGPARRGAPPGRRDGRPQELATSTVHRNALLATLGPEQLPIAEQLLRGGIPSVRQAIEEQNRAALAQGRPTVAPETILSIAENLLPLTTLAAWKDRAAAVQQAGPSVRLRDLRPVVTAARTTTLDEEARGVLRELQSLLHVKTEELRAKWVEQLESLLSRNEAVEALLVASRPPDQSTRLTAALATALAEAASRALSPELTATAWIAVLDAVVASPVRRSVQPAGIPEAAEARAAAVRAAGHVPALAKLLGMPVPPPPPQRRPALSGRRSS